MSRLGGQIALLAGLPQHIAGSIQQRLLLDGGAVVFLRAEPSGLVDGQGLDLTPANTELLYTLPDLTDRPAVERSMSRLRAAGLDSIDLLILGVDDRLGKAVALASHPDQWWAIVARHIRAAQILITQVVPGMVQRNRGRVVLIVDSRKPRGAMSRSAHAVGASGLVRLTEILDSQLGCTEVRALMLQIDTPLDASSMASRKGEDMEDPAGRRVADCVAAIAAGRLDQRAGQLLRVAEEDLDPPSDG